MKSEDWPETLAGRKQAGRSTRLTAWRRWCLFPRAGLILAPPPGPPPLRSLNPSALPCALPPVLPAAGYGHPWGPGPDRRARPGPEGAEDCDRGRWRLRQDFIAHGVQPGLLPRGQEDYDRLRPLSYQNTHLVLICYDVMNPTSYDNVLIKVRPTSQPTSPWKRGHRWGSNPDAQPLLLQWFPEVTHFCRGTPTVLIGCKTDLRKDKEQLRKLRAAQLEPITYMQGQSACEQIRAALYLECSAKFRENVEDVFREAAKVALGALKKAQRQKKLRLCLLL
uniref:Ras homolog family member F, filopodia associated n=1 Tax=Sus scrofa TaxID=9823 RepID=A0A8D2C0X8_PIG